MIWDSLGINGDILTQNMKIVIPIIQDQVDQLQRVINDLKDPVKDMNVDMLLVLGTHVS